MIKCNNHSYNIKLLSFLYFLSVLNKYPFLSQQKSVQHTNIVTILLRYIVIIRIIGTSYVTSEKRYTLCVLGGYFQKEEIFLNANCNKYLNRCEQIQPHV